MLLTEYLADITETIHYQDKEDNLMFRYDNAAHKPPLPYTDHKHIKGNIQQYDVPDIKGILEEIICNYLKALN